MKSIKAIFSSSIFWVFINLWGMIIPILYCPVFITKSSKMADHGAKVWAKVAIWILKKVCGIDYQVRGLNKLPKDEVFVVACKHQSMWETIVMHLIFNAPAYAYKKELFKIPFYGWYLKIMTGISIDRKGGATALKNLVKDTKKCLAQGHNVVIFPQGTRVPAVANPEKYPYMPGIAAIYTSCSVKVVPAALNSGIFWGRNKLSKKPGTIILEFLDPIEPGLNKKEFMSLLEKKTEDKSKELYIEATSNK